jgi:hypothetical protein
MKTLSFIGLLILVLFANSCAKATLLKPLECQVFTHVLISTYQSITVTYELRATGDHQLTQWYYFGPNGKTIIQNPQLPAMVTVTLGLNDSIYSGARGRVTEGSFRVSYRAVAADTLFIASDLCIQNLNSTPILP